MALDDCPWRERRQHPRTSPHLPSCRSCQVFDRRPGFMMSSWRLVWRVSCSSSAPAATTSPPLEHVANAQGTSRDGGARRGGQARPITGQIERAAAVETGVDMVTWARVITHDHRRRLSTLPDCEPLSARVAFTYRSPAGKLPEASLVSLDLIGETVFTKAAGSARPKLDCPALAAWPGTRRSPRRSTRHRTALHRIRRCGSRYQLPDVGRSRRTTSARSLARTHDTPRPTLTRIASTAIVWTPSSPS
jgi:hypothetical protein